MNKFQKPISKYLIWVIWPFPVNFRNAQERKVACETIVGFHGCLKSHTDPPEWHHLHSIDLSNHNLLLFETVQDPLLMTHNLINHLVLNSKGWQILMRRFTNEIYLIIKPPQCIRINDFYASHLVYFRSKKTHTSPNSNAYLYIPKTNASNANNHCNPLFTPRYTIYVCHDWISIPIRFCPQF